MVLTCVTPHNADLAAGPVASGIERHIGSVSDSQAGLKDHVPCRPQSPICHFTPRLFAPPGQYLPLLPICDLRK